MAPLRMPRRYRVPPAAHRDRRPALGTDDRSGALDCGLALPLDGALALCRLGGAAFGVKTPGSTTAVRLLAAGIANGVAGTVTVAAADAGEQLGGLMLSHTTTVNEWVPPTKTGVVKVVGAPTAVRFVEGHFAS